MNNLKSTLDADLILAMKSKDSIKVTALKNLKSEITKIEKSTQFIGKELTDSDYINIIKKVYNQRMESYKIYTDSNRSDLAEPEIKEAEILKVYLPEKISEEKLVEFITTLIKENDYKGNKSMGIVISETISNFGDGADKKDISRIAKNLLN